MTNGNSRPSHELTWTTIEDEFANSVTHGIGLLLAIGGFCSLVVLTSYGGDLSHIIGCMVYGVSLVVLYGASTLYHFVRQPRLKKLLQTVDHVAIYFFIAGTYTPFTLVNLHGFWSWMLFGLVWGLGMMGIIAKITWGDRWGWLSVVAYLGLGWCCLIAAKPLLESVPMGAVLWLVAGGLAYSTGVIFFAFDYIRYFHAIWHVFVIAGSICHFCAVIFYVVPTAT
jgi:hemolysin III